MIFDEKTRALAESFENVPYHKFMGLKFVEAGKGFAELKLPVKKEILNGNGVVHGGMYYTLCDLAASAALETDKADDQFYVTHDINVSIFSSVNTGVLTAKAEVLKTGKRLAFVEARIYNDKDELLAAGRLTKTFLTRK